jgi:hypothetical protein
MDVDLDAGRFAGERLDLFDESGIEVAFRWGRVWQ